MCRLDRSPHLTRGRIANGETLFNLGTERWLTDHTGDDMRIFWHSEGTRSAIGGMLRDRQKASVSAPLSGTPVRARGELYLAV